MEQVNLAQAASLKKEYNGGMFVDFGVQFPLGDGYGTPTVSFYVPTKDNTARIKRVRVTSDDETPDSYGFMMAFSQFSMPSLSVTFGKDKGKKMGNLLFQKDFPEQISLNKAQSRRAYLTHDMHGGLGNVSEPELIEDVVAYIGQSNCCGSENVTGNLMYLEEPSKESVRKALRAISKNNPYLVQLCDEDIGSIVEALFAEKVRSLHEGEDMVDNKVFRNAA